MDVKIIEQKQLVERYLFGRLSPPEAKFFEQLVRKSPELAERMGLPMALKRTMHLLDETNTEWREQAPPLWQRPWVSAVLAGLFLLTLVLAISMWSGKSAMTHRYNQLREQAAGGLLPAPAMSKSLRLRPARGGEHVPTYAIGARLVPQMTELRIDVDFIKNNLFKLTINRDDGTFWGRLENQVKDSNGDLRVAFNSAAFAAGTYVLEIDSVNLRGDGEAIGKLRLRVDPS